MDTVNKISESFFLLKKRIREQDINDLISSSNRSLVTVIQNLNAKPKENIEKKNKEKFLLAPAVSQKYSLSENKFSNLLETKIKKIKDKNDKKPGQTQKKKVNNNNSNTMLPQPGILPPDNLLNLAFNKNTLSKLQNTNLSSKNDSNSTNNLNNNNKNNNIYNDDTEMLSPEIINDDNNTINSPEIKNNFEKTPGNLTENKDPFELN